MGNYNNSCGYQQYHTKQDKCEKRELPNCIVPAMAYVPFQQWCEVYTVDKAFCRGTLFPVLDKPFVGGRYKW